MTSLCTQEPETLSFTWSYAQIKVIINQSEAGHERALHFKKQWWVKKVLWKALCFLSKCFFFLEEKPHSNSNHFFVMHLISKNIILSAGWIMWLPSGRNVPLTYFAASDSEASRWQWLEWIILKCASWTLCVFHTSHQINPLLTSGFSENCREIEWPVEI